MRGDADTAEPTSSTHERASRGPKFAPSSVKNVTSLSPGAVSTVTAPPAVDTGPPDTRCAPPGGAYSRTSVIGTGVGGGGGGGHTIVQFITRSLSAGEKYSTVVFTQGGCGGETSPDDALEGDSGMPTTAYTSNREGWTYDNRGAESETRSAIVTRRTSPPPTPGGSTHVIAVWPRRTGEEHGVNPAGPSAGRPMEIATVDLPASPTTGDPKLDPDSSSVGPPASGSAEASAPPTTTTPLTSGGA